MRAADYYSGVGGWSLGLRLADIEVIASYERWHLANKTNRENNGHQVDDVDIRNLDPSTLRRDLDLIVGSPPCTQFSFSNRGGQGDLKDGLRDIAKFLEIVDYCKPRFWVMENVPRLAQILEKELSPRGSLRAFRHLPLTTLIVNMEDYGIPQKRKRCLAGNIPFDVLESYKGKLPRVTLGDVLCSLAKSPAIDPVFGHAVDSLSDHVLEAALNVEEERINRAAKVAHPIYNSMSFPDRLDKASRTITATCTRVSRESIIVLDNTQELRRLTLRERASVQSFPVDFQFYGETYTQKLKMIGNAIPPLLSMLVGHACRGTPPEALPKVGESIKVFRAPTRLPPVTPPERPGRRYPCDRTFRFAIPALHFKSGVRFELSNHFQRGVASWVVSFVYGTPSDIRVRLLDTSVCGALARCGVDSVAGRELEALTAFLRTADIKRMQDVWAHRGPGATRPFDVLDALDDAAIKIHAALTVLPLEKVEAALNEVLTPEGTHFDDIPGAAKLNRNAYLILAGLAVGSRANLTLQPRERAPSLKGVRGLAL